MRALLGFFSFLFLIFLGIAVGIAVLIGIYAAPGPLPEETIIQVERGQGLRQIAATLESENVIISKYPFMIGARIKNGGKPIQAGEYRIPARADMGRVLDMMQNGEIYHRFFTIPEGRTSWEIVQILKTVDGLQGDLETVPPEGSLMPETYAYSKGDSRHEKIARMQGLMNETLAAAWETRAENLPFTSPEEALILASIVEKETGVAGEYKKVAGVFINRLKKGMPLQSDPTVIYGMTMGQHEDEGMGPIGRRLLSSDLEKDSPFNTYTNPNLPPTPICNPGKAAIEAVMNPAIHDYLYFVADGTGGHAFAETLAGHNANVAEWRKIRNSQ